VVVAQIGAVAAEAFGDSVSGSYDDVVGVGDKELETLEKELLLLDVAKCQRVHVMMSMYLRCPSFSSHW